MTPPISRNSRGIAALLYFLLCLVPAASWATQPPAPPAQAREFQRAEYFSYNEMMVNYCDELPGKKYTEIAQEVKVPERMLYLCDQAGAIHALKGEMSELEAPEKFNGQSSFQGLPFKIRDDAETAENGKKTEEYDVWFATQTRFGMRIANHTKMPISRFVLGFKSGDCIPPGNYFYEKLMLITSSPIPPGQERLVKWKIPPDIHGDELNCIDIIRVSPD